MTEEQAKRLAMEFVARSNLDPCKFDSIRRFPRGSLAGPANGDEWVVRFAFELPMDVACSTEMALIVVDDATGETRLCDSL